MCNMFEVQYFFDIKTICLTFGPKSIFFWNHLFRLTESRAASWICENLEKVQVRPTLMHTHPTYTYGHIYSMFTIWVLSAKHHP